MASLQAILDIAGMLSPTRNTTFLTKREIWGSIPKGTHIGLFDSYKLSEVVQTVPNCVGQLTTDYSFEYTKLRLVGHSSVSEERLYLEFFTPRPTSVEDPQVLN